MKPFTGVHSRALLTFHHILSSQKKRTIREAARELELCGICKVGYPGILAVEGGQTQITTYVRQIKALRWASCTLANVVSGLDEADLHMTAAARRSNSESPSAGIEMFEKMSEVGAYMRRVGLEGWWRTSMRYRKND